MKSRYVFLLLIVGIFVKGCAQRTDSSKNDARFSEFRNQIANESRGLTKSSTADKKFRGIRSVLISQSGELLYEQYFNDGSRKRSVNVASLGKSFLSAMVGIAIQKGMISSVQESIYHHFPYSDYANWDPRKAQINIEHLLTMTPGWRCGNIGNYRAHCGAKITEKKERFKWLLDVPMDAKPGSMFSYNDAVPQLLAAILTLSSQQPARELFEQMLREPLGLSKNLYDGNHLTSRDLMKFGQLYLKKGVWHDKQLLDPKWIEQSFDPHVTLKQYHFADAYGYLWWQKAFVVGDVTLQSYYAAGNGGQYVFIVPALELVVVFTGNNYGNITLTQQPIEMMAEWILPAIIPNQVSWF